MVKTEEELESGILSGDWPKVLKIVSQSTFANSSEVYEAVYAHLVMEMVCLGEKHLAR